MEVDDDLAHRWRSPWLVRVLLLYVTVDKLCQETDVAWQIKKYAMYDVNSVSSVQHDVNMVSSLPCDISMVSSLTYDKLHVLSQLAISNLSLAKILFLLKISSNAYDLLAVLGLRCKLPYLWLV